MKNRKSLTQKTLRGDTLVEVMFAVGIFALAAISASALMNKMLGNAQASLEITMARTEIDTQGEALRYLSESYSNAEYKTKWDAVAALAQGKDEAANPITKNPSSCQEVHDNAGTNAFIINPRTLDVVKSSEDKLGPSSLFPRLLFNNSDIDINANRSDEVKTALVTAEGIWVTAYKDADTPNFYDFYIQTCWNAPGSTAPTTINSSIRINNPIKSDIAIVQPPETSTPDNIEVLVEFFHLFNKSRNFSNYFKFSKTNLKQPIRKTLQCRKTGPVQEYYNTVKVSYEDPITQTLITKREVKISPSECPDSGLWTVFVSLDFTKGLSFQGVPR